MNRIRNQRGAVAIIAVVMLLVFAVGGATIATLTSTGARTGAEHRQGVQALYLAETALEWAANRLAQAPDDDFDEACNNLAGEELAIGQSGATGARIAEAGIDGDDCELLILAGAPSLSGTETDSRRRLEVAVGRNVGNPGGGGGNPVADPGNWSGKTCKGSQSCSNGSITFSAGKGLTRSNSVDDLIKPDSFEEGDEIFFFLTVSGDLVDFGLKSGGSGEFQPAKLLSTDPASDSNVDEAGFGVGIALGDGLTPDDLNDDPSLQFIIEWEDESITVEDSCIGTIDYCDAADANEPSTGWGEG